MPSSNPETIPCVVGVAWRLVPKSVLDVGAGYGKFGALFREYCELAIANGDPADAKLGPHQRKVQIDALEGFPMYVGALHRAVYDNIFTVALEEFLSEQWAYDLIFLGDVLEHIDREVALRDVLPRLIERAQMGVLISVPATVRRQDAVFGNDLEIHRSQWFVKDFRRLTPYVHVGRKGSHLVAFVTRSKECLKRARGGRLRQKVRALRQAMRDGW